MKIFLVRHGQSQNQGITFASPETPLSETGIKQAQAVSQRSRFQAVDTILSSQYQRAKQTAEIVSQTLNLPIKIIEGIQEKALSSQIYGLDRTSPIVKKYDQQALQNLDNFDWKFRSDDEPFRQVIHRAQSFKQTLLQDYQGKNILVFSHELFIRTLVTSILLGDKFRDKDFHSVATQLVISNTGITFLGYKEKEKRWKLIYLNDFSHFKEIK